MLSVRSLHSSFGLLTVMKAGIELAFRTRAPAITSASDETE